MNLEQYLKQLKISPDKELTSKLGVYDNYPVVLSIDYDAAKIKLLELSKLTHFESKSEGIKVEGFKYDDKIHILRLHHRKYSTAGFDDVIKSKVSQKNYDCFFFLHPYQIENGFYEHRKMADMIIYLSEEFLIKNNISSFFPSSSGYSSDPKKIVFYEPEESK